MNKTINYLTNKELINLLDRKVDAIKEAYRLKCFYVSKNESIELIGIVRFFRSYLDALEREQYNYYLDLAFELKAKSEQEIANRQ